MKNGTRKIVLVSSLTVAIILFFIFVYMALYQVANVQVAHSSFDNYYKFRGCVSLINRTSSYGYCSLASGEIIKIVEYNGKWYLDGDLPNGWPF